MLTRSFDPTAVGPWLRDTAATRQQRRIGAWVGAMALVLPLLFYPVGAEWVFVLYVAVGGLVLLVAWGWRLQQTVIKYCPACKAPNPVDARVCQRCGTRPTQAGSAPCV